MNWINLQDVQPPPKTRINLARYENGILIWETTGWLLKGTTYSVKYVDGLTISNSHPTHWKLIAEDFQRIKYVEGYEIMWKKFPTEF